MRRSSPRSLLQAVAPLIVAGTFTAAATAAAGKPPATETPIPDTAFAPVTVPSAPAGDLPLPTAASPGALGADDDALRTEERTGVITALTSDSPDRAQPTVPEPKAIVVDIQPATSHLLRGPASWYCRAGVSPCTFTHPDLGGFDAYAAAGPKLRAAIGPGWQNSIVWVDGIRVKLIDWCQCYRGEPQEKLLDLYFDVYARTGGSVTIRW